MEEKQEKTIKKILLFKNPFDVLEVSTKDSLETIQKKYKKLSLIIHPDKCKLPKAEDAFAALRKALTTLEDPEAFKAFAAITEQSRFDSFFSLWCCIILHLQTCAYNSTKYSPNSSQR
jgi:curved DNA-binding protein CbpA